MPVINGPVYLFWMAEQGLSGMLWGLLLEWILVMTGQLLQFGTTVYLGLDGSRVTKSNSKVSAAFKMGLE